MKKNDIRAMHTARASAPDLSSVLARIRSWAAANDLKPATYARLAGVAEVVTRDMAGEGWSPSSRSIRRLESLIPAGWKAGDPVPGGHASAAEGAGAPMPAGEVA